MGDEMDINLDLLNKKREDLIKFEGWLPQPFPLLIDMDKREEYLREKGIYDEVKIENLKERQESKTTNDISEYRIRKLKEWLFNNPKFNGIIVFNE